MLLSILAFTSLSGYAGYPEDITSAQEQPSQQEAAKAPENDQVCLSPTQLTLSHNFGKGVGHKGYSSLDFFYVHTNRPAFSPFVDLRFHVMDQGRIALNTGIGFRSLTWQDKLSVGANLYYDYRNSPKLHTQQIAGGIELLSEYIDFRVNGYLPVAGKMHSDALKFVGFSGHNINVNQKTYYAFPSTNAEFGIPMPWIAPDYIETYLGVGPYYLFGETVSGNRYPNSWGGKFRLAATITDFFTVEFQVNHDRIFNTTFQGIVSFNIPLYKTSACRGPRSGKGRDSYLKRTLRPVMRNEIIPVKKKSVDSSLKNSSGERIQAYFVNNLAGCPGTGTFESPFCTLAGASVAPSGPVVVYVFEGNSPTTPYTGGFVMKSGQTLQGSALPLTLNGLTIPPLTSGNPVLTNVGGPAVTLASSTTVKGITIQGTDTTYSGILGTNVADVTITDNVINPAGQHGIDIQNHSGNTLIANNIIRNPVQNGISIDASTNPGSIVITNNTLINDRGGALLGSGVLIRLENPAAFGLVSNNTITSTGGFFYDIGTEVVQGSLSVIGNQMTSDTEIAIHALDGKQIFSNNTINNSSTTAGPIGIAYNTTGLRVAPAENYIYNNHVNMTGASGVGIDSVVSTTGSLYTEIVGNNVTTVNPANGISVRTLSADTICTSVTGNNTNTITLNGSLAPVNVQQTQTQYTSSNTASVGFTQVGTVNFGSTCTAP